MLRWVMDPLERTLADDGFAFANLRAALGPLPDWESFAATWAGLKEDPYRAEGDRLRRHAAFRLVPGGTPVHLPGRPHFQSKEYNPLYGGIERTFSPIAPEVAEGATVRALLAFCEPLFGRLKPAPEWLVELHQFRIRARPGRAGNPTPEGVHRDGVDFALALLVRRENVERGTTSVHAPDGRRLGSFTLTEPLDAAFVDDARVLHGVTPVTPLDPAKPAHRDVLVATFVRA